MTNDNHRSQMMRIASVILFAGLILNAGVGPFSNLRHLGERSA